MASGTDAIRYCDITDYAQVIKHTYITPQNCLL